MKMIVGGLLVESDNVIYFVDLYCMKTFSTSYKTVKFLETFRNLYNTFSVHEKKENYELLFLESTCRILNDYLETLKND